MSKIRFETINGTLCRMVEPEPIFAIGDKVTDGVIDGTIVHIEDAIADVCPSTDEYKIELRNLNHIPESPKQDDVEKPLRSMIAEAKAIGKNIRTYYQDIVFTPQALEACLNQGKFRWWNICNWELTTREQNYYPSISTSSDRPKEEQQHTKEPIADCENCKHVCTNSNIDHCHMYEPQPAYAVGEWVSDGVVQGRITYIDNEVVDVRATDDYVYTLDKDNLRKLKPSEVVIRIGCLSGTVKPSYYHDGTLLTDEFILYLDDVKNATIAIAMLDKPTKSLVMELLEKQGEGK